MKAHCANTEFDIFGKIITESPYKSVTQQCLITKTKVLLLLFTCLLYRICSNFQHFYEYKNLQI